MPLELVGQTVRPDFRLFRSIKLLEIGAGTTEVRKMIIADELLKGGGRNVA